MNQKKNFKVVKAIPGFKTFMDARHHRNPKGKVKAGSYYLFKQSFDMVKVSPNKYEPGLWINPADNVKKVKEES